jgi:hypothetical protein
VHQKQPPANVAVSSLAEEVGFERLSVDMAAAPPAPAAVKNSRAKKRILSGNGFIKNFKG